MPKNTKISYEPEADVIMLEKGTEPIEYAEEIGNFVVHFTKKNNPVIIEILQASKFLSKVGKMMPERQHARVKMA